MGKIVLRVLWLEKTIGIALDESTGKSSYPMTEYFFWPRKDAWDELKSRFDSYSWVDQEEAVELLNKITELIQLWQEEDKKVSFTKYQEKYPECIFSGNS